MLLMIVPPGQAGTRAGTSTNQENFSQSVLQTMSPMLEELKKYPDVFAMEDNLFLAVKEDAVHAYEEVYHHVWHYLPQMFK